MNKKSYVEEIKKLADDLRSKIKPDSLLNLRSLQHLEEWEEKAVLENTRKAYNEFKDYISIYDDKKIITLKSLGKKYVTVNGRIKRIIKLK